MRRLVTTLLAGLCVFVSACTSSEPDSTATPTVPTVSPSSPAPAGDALNATTAPLLPTDRFELPALDPDGFAELLGQLRGTPVLVNVWGSWCPPCRTEAPALSVASEEFGERVQFLGIDILDDRESARIFMREFEWRYPSIFDVNGAIRDDLGFVGQPITLIFDASGERTLVHQGQIGLEKLRAELGEVV
jgi:thiol-disulfide isomerase/thioredoxin